ncbi:BTB/POZ domain-containing adapter for CUL3-mediated RhoA degradation protein 1 [Phytophthora citrophthora]|uniref:BTB/POZ domain-containing adapter for CUL3-mediated RhoA degradation protein 1 n=1 Tax=Phytophthora citrophthora TaxID=4793 RepID=A0AAD9GX94_9STRA|nr:BTB/POZ domain-containing adapter for CUL3-mediated RhoA degradation protein 1 [Phytophthora citrophthora]
MFLRRELEREWALIESAQKRLVEEKKKVVDEWVSVEDAQREYDAKRDEFEKTVSKHFSFLPEDAVVIFNVGGQLFKSTVKVWTRDRFSILAQLCTKSPKLQPDKDGSFFFDRDFMVFRLILEFLRDNRLPDTVEELRELYCEASFYRLGLVRHAIEARMIGEETMAANVLHVRPLRDSKGSSPTDLAEGKEKVTDTPASENSTFSIPSNYSALPDPFGFTSKK